MTDGARSGGTSSSPLNVDRPRPALCVLDLEGRITWTGGGGSHPLFASGGAEAEGSRFCDHWQAEDAARVAAAVTSARQNGHATASGRSALGNMLLDVALELRAGGSERPPEIIASVSVPGDDREQMLFNAIPTAIWMTRDLEANYIVGNAVTEQRFEFAPGTNQSLSQPSETRHDRYRYVQNGREVPGKDLPVQRACRGEDVCDEEFEIHAKNGSVRNVILSASPMRDAQGMVVGSVCVETDVTKRKRIERTQQLLLECSQLTGPKFFPALTAAISEALGARQVYIAEIPREKTHWLRTLAAHIDGKPGTYGEFEPHDTPCVDVMKGADMFIPSGVLDLYPNAEVLRANRVDSYIGTPLRATDGEIIGLIGVLHEKPIDPAQHAEATVQVFAGRAAAELQRIRSEASLRKSEEKYRIITDVIPLLVAFIDAEQRYQFANAAYKRWFGFDPELLKGRHLRSVMSDEAFARISPYVRRALRGERVSYENYIAENLGPIRHVQAEYVPQFSEDGHVIGFFAFIIDISDRKQHEEALSRSEARFRVLFEQLPIGVAMVDLDGNVLLENDVLSKLLPANTNTADSNIFDRTCTAPPDNEDEAENSRPHPIKEALQGRVSRDEEFLCEHPDGQKRWIKTRGIPIRGASDEIVGGLMVVDDIHDEKLAEARRRLLINELNHRVKNTLAGVQSIATQTFRGSNFTPAALEAFEERLLALSNVHNLLTYEGWEGTDLKRLAALVMEPYNPGADRLCIEGPNIRLKPQAALALAMALHELATNAVKYGSLSVPGGTLRISWHIAGDGTNRRMQLTWVERGGPPVSRPVSKGFGTRLIERSLAFELDSASSIRFEPDGVVCEIDADLREIVG